MHAGEGACACATKYGRADRMTDGGTLGAAESGDSRDTSSHSPTHFRPENSTFSFSPSSLSLSSPLLTSTGFLSVSSTLVPFVPADVPCAPAMDSHAWIDRPALFSLRLSLDVTNSFMHILNRLEISGTFSKTCSFRDDERGGGERG